MFCSCANYFMDGNCSKLSLYCIRMGLEIANDYLTKSISEFFWLNVRMLCSLLDNHISSRRKLKESTQANVLTEMKSYKEAERKKILSEPKKNAV